MSRKPASLFHEEQRLSQRRTRLLTAIPPAGMLLLAIWQVALGHPLGKNPMSNGSLIGWTIFLWLVYLRLITSKLVTDVRPGEVRVTMRGLWRKQRISLEKVQAAERVTFNAATDWGGYGIRYTRKGKAYLASGNEGAQLDLAGGGVLLIGSQHAADLVRAIEDAKGR